MTHWLARVVVRLSGFLVPSSYRGRFVEEWRGEISNEADARRALRRSFGCPADAIATRRLYPSRRGRTTSMMFRDVRFALRSFVRRPWWTAVVLLTLAVGIGANTAIFSLLYAVLLRPLDYPESERLVKVTGAHLDTGARRNLSPDDFYDLQAENTSFASMGAHGWVGFFTITGDGEPERIPGTNVTAGFFRTLAISPRLGRLFTREDDEPGAPPTALLTHGLWQRRFGADPNVIGRTMEVNAVAHTVIGVLPADYRHPEPNPDREPELYSVYQFERGVNRSGRFIRAVGRLEDGRTLDEARSELEAIASRLRETYPESNTNAGVRLLPLKEAVVRDARTGLLVLLGAVVAVLLIACANIANLQLANGSARRQELAIKAALGAARGRLVKQLVTESLVLSFAGGGLGLLAAYWTRSFLTLPAIPRADELAFSWPVFLFASLAAALAAILFGLAPALALSSGDLRRGFSRGSARELLVACEVAIALVLLVGAGLFMKSLAELSNETPGFEPERVLTMQVSLPTARYEEGEQIPFYEELSEKIAALPGVRAVGAVNILPLSQNYSSDSFQIEERPVPEGEQPAAEARSVNRDYFTAMGIPLLRGRTFDERDRADTPGVIVISESMAKRFWPGEDPIGKRITYNRALPEDSRLEVGGPGSREIVGIVGDVKHFGLDDSDVAMFYTPQAHQPSFHTMTLVLRTGSQPELIARSVRDELASMDANVPLYAVRSLAAVIDKTVDAPRFRTHLLGAFAALALALALVGVYAVVGVSVVQRTREIGIRLALGAHGAGVIAMLVQQSMRPVAWGLALGLVGAVVGTRWLESLLFRVAVTDAAVYVAVASLLGLSALLAAFVPTLKAMKIDPVETLKAE